MEGKERKWKESEREEGNPASPSFPRTTQHLPTVTEKEYSWRSLQIMRTLAIGVGTRVMGFHKDMAQPQMLCGPVGVTAKGQGGGTGGTFLRGNLRAWRGSG